MADIRARDNLGSRCWRRVRGVAKPGAVVALLLASGGLSVGVHSNTQPPSDDSLALYAALVAEMDLRRRVNVLHPNPQSILDGFHVGHVNVGAGNLTFRRRDMVARANGTVVFARVYDSRIQDNADLGPGWRLSLAEELRLDGDRAVYTDRSGAAHTFRWRKDGEYMAAPPTPRHADTTLDVTGDKAVLRERGGVKRVFLRAGADAPFLLRRVVSADGRKLLFGYENGRLSAVTHDGTAVFTIVRQRDGKVREVADRHGRSVGYSYSADGRLKDVYDVAGNLWWHEYDANGRLTEAFGANGRPYLLAGYDDAGRVADTRAGRMYRYAYEASRTVVSDGDGRQHVFEQNPQGATERYSANTGAWWKIGFGAGGRVVELDMPGRTLRYAYDAVGNVTAVWETAGTVSGERRFAYDDGGRLTVVEDEDGNQLDVLHVGEHAYLSGLGVDFDFRTSAGRVDEVWDGKSVLEVERDDSGEVTALRRSRASVVFERDGLGRIVGTTYADGTTARYSHDLLGNRDLVEYHDGSSVRYRHDAAGNIVRVDVTEADGSALTQTTHVGDMNRVERVEYEGSGAIDVAYDNMGRPVRFDTAADTVSARYDNLGALAELKSETTGAAWRPPADEDSAPAATDPRRTELAGDRLGPVQPEHAVVDFDEHTFAPAPRDPVALAMPGLAEARALAAAAAPLFARGGAGGFEKPSNPVFQAPEYRSTNCCIACPYDVCVECHIGGVGANISPWCRCSPSIFEIVVFVSTESRPGPVDKLGQLIQEYEGLTKRAAPLRTDFVTEHNSENFSTKEYNGGTYPYFMVGRMPEIAEAVRKAYNDSIDSDPNTDYGLILSSGYRNPVWNRHVGGKEYSKHQWGEAVDLEPMRNPNSTPPGKSYEELMVLIQEAADSINDGQKYYIKNEADHIHVQIK